MSLLALIQEFDGKEIGEDRNGNPIHGKLLPGATKADLIEIAGLIPCPIPQHMKDVLDTTRGLLPSLHMVDFTGLSLKDLIETGDLCPSGWPIAGDEFGNFWVVDLLPNSKDWGPIYFVCHDPPVMVLQAQNFEDFVAQLIALARKEEDSPIERVTEKLAHRIYHENPNVQSYEDAKQLVGDGQLSSFASSLDKSYQFIDMRKARVGEGFSWGRYGPDTEIKRAGELRIFAYKKKAGFWQKLFGGG